MVIQMLAATASIIPFTAVSGGFALPVTFAAMSSVAWLALVGSIAAFLLLFYALKRQPGASATSYLFLVPPATALAAVPVLGQHLTPAAIAAEFRSSRNAATAPMVPAATSSARSPNRRWSTSSLTSCAVA